MTEFFHSCTTNERKREIGKQDVTLKKYKYEYGVEFSGSHQAGFNGNDTEPCKNG